MHQSSSICSPQTRTRPASECPAICVVDPATADYETWQREAETAGMDLRICGTAEEALRLGRTQRIDLWVVNTKLPGLSGFELCGMLRERSTPAAVYLVADEYSPAAERAALKARATLFGCKGAHATWLTHWRLAHADRRALEAVLSRR